MVIQCAKTKSCWHHQIGGGSTAAAGKTHHLIRCWARAKCLGSFSTTPADFHKKVIGWFIGSILYDSSFSCFQGNDSKTSRVRTNYKLRVGDQTIGRYTPYSQVRIPATDEFHTEDAKKYYRHPKVRKRHLHKKIHAWKKINFCPMYARMRKPAQDFLWLGLGTFPKLG